MRPAQPPRHDGGGALPEPEAPGQWSGKGWPRDRKGGEADGADKVKTLKSPKPDHPCEAQKTKLRHFSQ